MIWHRNINNFDKLPSTRMADARQKTFHLSALLVFLRNLLEEFGPEKIGKANINIYFTWL